MLEIKKKTTEKNKAYIKTGLIAKFGIENRYTFLKYS